MTEPPDSPKVEPAKVEPLFKDRPSAAGLSPQPEVVDALCEMLIAAQSGKLTGFAFLCFDGTTGRKWIGATGKIVDSDLIAGLEQLKFRALMQWSCEDDKPR